MFKIYNLNYEEIPLPVDRLGYGIKGLDIHIGPIIYDTVYNQVNGVDTPIKRYPVDRDVYINILSKSADTIDWRMKRDEMYSFFRNLGVFYIAEKHQPFKLLKVMVDVDYYVDRPVTTWGLAEITLKIVDTPFKQSLHTTGDIGSEGIKANDKWAAGMGLKSNEDKKRYDTLRFYNAGDEEVKLIQQKDSVVEIKINELPEKQNLFNKSTRGLNHYISESNGETLSSNNFDYSDWITVNGGEEYVLNIKAQWAEYDANKQYIRGHNTNSAVTLSDNTKFVRVSVRKTDVDKTMFYATSFLVDIDDGSTTFKICHTFEVGDILTLKGDKVQLNGNNVLADTNFNFLTIKKGWNNWEVRNVSDFDFRIDFRFLYD